jgi:hypothetical protein
MTYKSLIVLVFIVSGRLLEAGLISNVTVAAGPPIWSYTLVNAEPANSPNFISSFSLAVDAPITVTGTPAGWDFSTDNTTFVFWFNADPVLPYPNDVAPGTSLGGFSLTSTTMSSDLLSYGLTGWDHSLDEPGPTTAGTVLAPSVSESVSTPEPVTFVLLFPVLVAIGWRQRLSPGRCKRDPTKMVWRGALVRFDS